MTDWQLEEYVNSLYSRIEGRFSGLGSLPFLLLKEFGFRINEVVDYLNWDYNVLTNEFIIQTSKNGNKRYIKKELLPEVLVYNYFQGNFIFPSSSPSWYEYTISRVRPFPVFISDRKELLTHVFRHNVIKQLYLNSYSVEDIKIKMGIQKSETVMHYVNSTPFSPHVDPPPPGKFLTGKLTIKNDLSNFGISHEFLKIIVEGDVSGIFDLSPDFTFSIFIPNDSSIHLYPVYTFDDPSSAIEADSFGFSVVRAQRIQAAVTLEDPFSDPSDFVIADLSDDGSLSTFDALIMSQCLVDNPFAFNLLSEKWLRFVADEFPILGDQSSFSYVRSLDVTIENEEFNISNFDFSVYLCGILDV